VLQTLTTFRFAELVEGGKELGPRTLGHVIGFFFYKRYHERLVEVYKKGLEGKKPALGMTLPAHQMLLITCEMLQVRFQSSW
jgi:hypothetical protein